MESKTYPENPYGLSITKRLVVPTAEELLFKPIQTYQTGEVTLVDYMGGDDTVERVATAGHGADIFPEDPSQSELFEYLTAKGITVPFQSAQLKFQIQSSIRDALHMVYFTEASVNEYSGRYSTMIDSAFLPSAGYLISQMEFPTPLFDEVKIGMRAADLIAQSRAQNYDEYSKLVSKEIDLARELARICLETNNDTRFFWKVNLPDLVSFTSEKRRLKNKNNSLETYLNAFENAALAVSPAATAALKNKENGLYRKSQLTMPIDKDVVDPTPLPPSWEFEDNWTLRATVPELEEILFVKQPYLDHGAVQVVDYMGDDSAPAESARISYGAGTRRLQEDSHLTRYLLRHRHTTPFEHAELAVESKIPVFVDPRQAGRHRTLPFHCFMGEILLGSEYFVPPRDQLRYQDRKNRQGRGNELDEELKDSVLKSFNDSYKRQAGLEGELREFGVSEEDIRGSKGVGHYTFIWRTGNLHNWLHFLGLRMEPHAQKEMRDYANICADAVKRQAPTAFQAFMDYRFNAVAFSPLEQQALNSLMALSPEKIEDLEFYRQHGLVSKDKLSREGEEFQKKLKRILSVKQNELPKSE